MGALIEGKIWLTNKIDMEIKDLSERDWIQTNLKAIQIATTHQFIIALEETGTVIMLSIVANPNPTSNILLSENFNVIQTQVQIENCIKISASFTGLCFGVTQAQTNINKIQVW